MIIRGVNDTPRVGDSGRAIIKTYEDGTRIELAGFTLDRIALIKVAPDGTEYARSFMALGSWVIDDAEEIEAHKEHVKGDACTKCLGDGVLKGLHSGIVKCPRCNGSKVEPFALRRV